MSKKQELSKKKNITKPSSGGPSSRPSNSKFIEQDGEVVENCGNTNFKVQLDINGMVVSGTISGKMRMHYIKINVGDRVKVEMSPYDLSKCRIVKRL